METEVCFSYLQVTQELTPRLVGTIGRQTDPPADTWSNDATLPPSRTEYPPRGLPGGTQEVIADAGGSTFELIALAYGVPTPGASCQVRNRF